MSSKRQHSTFNELAGRAKPGGEKKNHLFIYLFSRKMSKRGQNKNRNCVTGQSELKVCAARGLSHGVENIQGYFRQSESSWIRLWCMIYIYIYIYTLKEVWDCFIKIHLQDEISNATSEHCEGFEDYPLESHRFSVTL